MRSTLSDIAALTDHALVDDLAITHTSLTISKARFILAVAEFHERKLAREQGAPTTAVWLMRRFNISYRTSAEYLNTGAKMRRFPAVAECFLSGEFSYSVIRLLGRYLTDDNVDELIDLARRLTLQELEQMLSGRPRPGGEKKRKTNVISVVVDPETGEVSFWGRLDAARGAEFLAAVKTGELAQLRELTEADIQQDQPVEEEAEVEDGAATPADPESAEEESCPLTRFGPPMGRSLFTGFLGMINIVRTNPRSAVRAPGAEVNILLAPDGRLVLPGHLGTEAANLLRTILNGTARIHLLDRNGVHLKLSRSARTVSAGLEKAILARWEYRCATPACPHTRFLEFHHIVAWSDGGGTDPDNLIPLCSACHAMVSAGRMTIHLDPVDPSILRFRFPGGHSHTSFDRGLPENNAHLGWHADGYSDGPVPLGDESLIIDHPEDSFDDVA